MVERAVGSFVEFFGIDRFVRGNRRGFGWVGCRFDHGEAPIRIEPPRTVAKQKGGGCTQVSEPVIGTRQTRGSPAYSHHSGVAEIESATKHGTLMHLFISRVAKPDR